MTRPDGDFHTDLAAGVAEIHRNPVEMSLFDHDASTITGRAGVVVYPNSLEARATVTDDPSWLAARAPDWPGERRHSTEPS
jgi:hypothetical protein